MNETPSKQSVLVVDDDEKVLTTLQLLLGEEPFEVTIARNGDEGLKVLEKQEVDLVLSDQLMPDMTGDEFFSQVRELYPSTIRVMLTGQASYQEAILAINKAGVYRYLTKPWDNDELLDAIRMGLEHKRSKDDLKNALEELQEKNTDLMKSNVRIKELQEFNENVFKNVQSGLIVMDVDGKVLKVNQAALNILMIKSENEVVGKSVSDISPSLSEFCKIEQAPMRRELELPLAETRTLPMELSSSIPLGFSSTYLLGADGEKQGIITVFRDLTKIKWANAALMRSKEVLEEQIKKHTAKLSLTNEELASVNDELSHLNDELNNVNEKLHMEIEERKWVEDALRDNKQRLQAILENSPALISLKYIEGTYQLVNERFATIFNVSRDKIYSMTDYEIFSENIADKIRANDEQVLEKNEPLEFEEEIPLGDEIRTYLAIRFPLYDPGGAAQSICSIYTDITRRKKASEAHKENELMFKAIAEASPSPISIIDAEGTYSYINPRFTEVFGYSLDDFKTGREWFTLAYPDPEYRKKAIHAWKKAIQEDEKLKITELAFDVSCKDGTVRKIVFKAIGVNNERQFITYEDLTGHGPV